MAKLKNPITEEITTVETPVKSADDTQIIEYAGIEIEVPSSILNDKNKMSGIFKQVRETSEFDALIDKKTGASTMARTLASPDKSPEDRLATIRKYYPDAAPYEGNFVFTHPETGKQTLFDETKGGIFGVQSFGDITQYGESQAKMLGGLLGAAPSVLAAAPTGGTSLLAASASAAAGSTAAGYAYDLLMEALGGVDTRPPTERMADTAIDFGVETAAGVVGAKVLKTASNLGAKALGGAKEASEDIYNLLVGQNTTPTAGLVSNSKIIKTAESALDVLPIAKAKMKKQIDTVTRETEAAAEKLANLMNAPATQEQTGKSIKVAAASSIDRFKVAQKEAESILNTKVGDKDIFSLDNTNDLLKKLVKQAGRRKSLATAYRPAIIKLQNILEKQKATVSSMVNADGSPIILSKGGAPRDISYRILREVRTDVGEKLGALSDGTSMKALSKQIYGALSQDINDNAVRLGFEKDFTKVNKLTRDWNNGASELLEKLVDDPADKIYKFLINGRKDGAVNLEMLKKNFTTEEWSQMQSTVLRKMGYPSLSNEFNQVWSMDTYLKNYKSFAEEAKDACFGSKSGLRTDLDNLVKTFGIIDDEIRFKISKNPKNTAFMLNLSRYFGTPAATAVNIAGATAGISMAPITLPLSKLMTSKAFVKWLAQPDLVAASNIGARMGQLLAIANENPEISEDIKAFLLAFSPQTSENKEKE